ncbi:MAG: TonB-dependent receptor plug domain-containing protein, partial [Pseudomonadota bacterium]
MKTNPRVSAAVRLALGVTAGFAVLGASQSAMAQDDDAQLEEITVTGTRITVPGVVSSSPIYSVGADEIELQAQPEVERILRLLPITKPDDGQNVNNGSDGAATVDLRGLGEERNLVLIDGKRATPYSIEGLVDLQTIPTALIERIDIITGGASAVYGSDAIAGALNFVMKKDFEGVDVRYNWTETSEGDGTQQSASITLGANAFDGRGNGVISFNWSDREQVLFGQRPLGQLGIDTSSGANYDRFLAGDVPAPAPAGCGGPGAVAEGGSTTTVPTRVAIAGGPALGQFRDDGTLGDDCSVFNFNPLNLYQTPQQRWGGMAIGRVEVSEKLEAYGSFRYSSINVTQQVAPSGIF